MPRGYRCILVAFVGWLSLAALPPQQSRTEAQTQTNQAATEALQNIAAALERQNETGDYQRKCEQGQDNRDSDLCAQWKAADSAQSAAKAAWRFGTWGIVLGILTLGAASAAAVFAGMAASETRRGANAAEDQLALATKSSAADFRPYLFVDRLELIDRRSVETDETDEDGEPIPGMFSGRIVIYFRNFGKVPARKIRVYTKEYSGRRFEGRFWGFSFSKIAVPICAPNHERRIFGHLYITAPQRMDFDLGMISRIIRLRFTYEDDVGEAFSEKAAFILYGSDLNTFYLLTDVRVAELRRKAKEYETEFDYDFDDDEE